MKYILSTLCRFQFDWSHSSPEVSREGDGEGARKFPSSRMLIGKEGSIKIRSHHCSEEQELE
jgi:hypothetical protein